MGGALFGGIEGGSGKKRFRGLAPRLLYKGRLLKRNKEGNSHFGKGRSQKREKGERSP